MLPWQTCGSRSHYLTASPRTTNPHVTSKGNDDWVRRWGGGVEQLHLISHTNCSPGKVLVNNGMFSSKQLGKLHVFRTHLSHVELWWKNRERCGLETDKREGEKDEMLIFTVSHTAALTVWHVWWMVLPCFCCPLTSTHCHHLADKSEGLRGVKNILQHKQ